MQPMSNRFMTDIDAAFIQQIFDIANGQREANVRHHRQADDLAARFETAKWIKFGYLQKLQIRPAPLKLVSSDKTSRSDASASGWFSCQLPQQCQLKSF